MKRYQEFANVVQQQLNDALRQEEIMDKCAEVIADTIPIGVEIKNAHGQLITKNVIAVYIQNFQSPVMNEGIIAVANASTTTNGV